MTGRGSGIQDRQGRAPEPVHRLGELRARPELVVERLAADARGARDVIQKPTDFYSFRSAVQRIVAHTAW